MQIFLIGIEKKNNIITFSYLKVGWLVSFNGTRSKKDQTKKQQKVNEQEIEKTLHF